MNIREELFEIYGSLTYLEPNTYDEAIIGVKVNCASPPLVVYDYELLIRCLIELGMTYEDAIDFYEYNIASAYIGESTPIIVDTSFGSI